MIRILLAGLVALAAMTAVFFAAAVVVVTGVVGWLLHLFRRAAPGPVAHPSSAVTIAADDAIDVEATKVPSDHPGA